tara:strand:+ start:2126 stop:3379 length:1254 start_codon:yes stop_codon:yes gene_type:complete
MKKITSLLLFIAVNTFAQTTFKKGYFITDNDVKKEVFFKAFNDEYPNSFFYKEAFNSDNIEEVLAENVTEVNIYNILRFVRKDISFEELEKGMISKKENNTMAFSKTKKNVLLKMHIDSENLSLLSYKDKKTDNVYLFLEENKVIKLLEYKIIKKNSKNYILKPFRKFLYQNYRIEGKDQINVGKLRYNEKDLLEYLSSYSASKNIKLKEYKYFIRDFKDALNINFLVGYSITSQRNLHSFAIYETSFNTNHLHFGASLEFFFNTNSKKSSIISSLIYLTNSESDVQNFSFGSGNQNFSLVKNDLNLLSLDFKYRQYFKVRTNHYLYINGGLGLNYSNGNTSYSLNTKDDFISDLTYNTANPFFIIGIGYNVNKLSFDFNYIPKYNGVFDPIIDNANSGNWEFNRQIINLTLSYELF